MGLSGGLQLHPSEIGYSAPKGYRYLALVSTLLIVMLPPPSTVVQLMPPWKAAVKEKMVQFVGVVSFQVKPKGVLRPKMPGELADMTPSSLQLVSV